ncbi:MAG: transposase [Thermoplasmata archaeon]
MRIGRNVIKSFGSRIAILLPIYIASNAFTAKRDIAEHLAYSGILNTFHHNRVMKYDNADHHINKLEEVTIKKIVDIFNYTLSQSIKPQKGIILIDITKDPYYGKDKRFTRGVNGEKGTNYAHLYLSFQFLGEYQKGYVAFIPVTQFTNIHKVISCTLKELSERYEILSVFADREFFNTDDLKTFKKYVRSFLTPATRNKGVKPKEEEMKREEFLFSVDLPDMCYPDEEHISEELKYTFEEAGYPLPPEAQIFEEKEDEWVISDGGKEYCWIDGTTENLDVYTGGKKIARHRMGVNRKEPVEFNLLRCWNEEKGKHYMFATDLDIPERDVHKFVEIYRNRWNIETGFSDRNKFRIRTTSNKYRRRVLFFGVSLLLYNIWQILKNRTNARKIDMRLGVTKWLFCSKCPHYPAEMKRNDDYYDLLTEPP